jgi:hypothetical protein
MARILYFTADQQLTAVHHDGSIYTSAKHFTGLTTDGRRVVVERAIERKANPSNHKCDARVRVGVTDIGPSWNNAPPPKLVVEQIAADEVQS